MGRLDEAAKLKVVELRRAGLSFRKIKAELELENIKVSAQAIYLFLREFQGRPPGRARPLEMGGTSASQLQARCNGAPEKWSGIHLQNLIRMSSQQSQRSDFVMKSPNPSGTNPPGSLGDCNSRSSSSSSSSQGLGHKENDIQIVSVTSLAQANQSIVQAPVTRTATSVACSTAITAALTRRRVSPSPTTNSMLAARKRILDKALSHRIKSFQQMASLLRRDQTSVQGTDLRNPVQQPSSTYSSERAAIENQSQGLGGTTALRYSVQRPSLSVRSPQPPPPRVGIRLPSQSVATSVPGISNLRQPTPPSSQSATYNERNCSPQQTIQESRVQSILQDQIQTLSSEVHSLGVSVKMLVEQQCRLEQVQVQQTNIQKQILNTLQTMSSKMGCCSTVQQQQKTPSPAAPKSTSFNQDSFICSQGTYVQCSQSQPSFNSIDTLETVEPFKLPELSPTSMNGFAACSSAESLPLIPSPLYQQQNTQAHMSGFTQNYVSAYTQSNNQTFAENKLAHFSNSCAVRTFQDCNISTEAVLSMNNSVQDQVNSIKVEGP